MKQAFCMLLTVALLLACCPALGETAPAASAAAAGVQPLPVPAQDAPFLPALPAVATEEEAIAAAKLLWSADLVQQDMADAIWHAEADDVEFGCPVYCVYADWANGDGLFAALKQEGGLRMLNVVQDMPFYDRECDASPLLTGREYTPQELLSIADPTWEEQLLRFFLAFAEEAEPGITQEIVSIYTAASEQAEDWMYLECWASVPGLGGSDMPGEDERHMELQVAPVFKVFNYGPGRG